MPRRAIIITLVVLILGIVGGSVALLVRRLPSPSPVDSGSEALPQAPSGALDPTADEDGDGLSNGDEKSWGASVTTADSDGDGFKDGEEVRSGHNPTIAGPNDKLPPGFVPGRGITDHTTTPAAAPSQTTSLLLAESRNLTEEYEKQVSFAERSPGKRLEFVQSLNLSTDLPAVPPNSLKVGQQNSQVDVYFYTLAIQHDDLFLNEQRLQDALAAFHSGNFAGVEALRDEWRKYRDRLQALTIPPAATQTHQLLLGYSEMMATLFNEMALSGDDTIRGLAALVQFDKTRSLWWPKVQQELGRLTSSSLSL